jgi:2-hydroxycyclohexanecarboxyl-CoA dehydrogenase
MTIAIDLTGRVAVVTGAYGGIGAAICAALEDAGATVARLDVSTSAVAHSGTAHQCDVSSEDSVARAAADVIDAHGRVDVVVNNAGVIGKTGMPFTRLQADDWDSSWRVNVLGTFNISRAFVPHLVERSTSSIVNIASVSGRTGFQTSPPYSASKAAVLNFTQVMARDLAPQGVRVNAICPGMVFTPFYRATRLAAAEQDPSLLEVSDEDYFQQKASSLIPLGRGQQPSDIAHAVAFLASDLARNITGQALNVDGGLVMS